MRTAGPTAGSALASTHLVEEDFEPAFPSLGLFGRGDPADPFVSRQWSDVFP